MLIRQPLLPRQNAGGRRSGSLLQRSGHRWEEDDAGVDAYGSEDEEQWDAVASAAYDEMDGYAEADGYDGSEDGMDDDGAEDYEDEDAYADDDQVGASGESDAYLPAYDEEASDYEEAGEEDAPAWDGDFDDAPSAEGRALVPMDAYRPARGGLIGAFERLAHAPVIAALRKPAPSEPVFIAGKDQPEYVDAHATRPFVRMVKRRRPFFVHSLLFTVVVLSLLITAVALVPLSSDQRLLTTFSTLAGFSSQPETNVVQYRLYTVHYADTLQSIASRFGVQQGGILMLNDLVSADQLFVGLRIKVPLDPNYGAHYHALLDLPLAPLDTPPPPYGLGIQPPGFYSFAVSDYPGDPWAGSFGQCTWWAQHKRPDENFYNFGDAWNWVYSAQAHGMVVTTTPVANATVVFAPGVEEAGPIGHVAHVEQLLSDGWVLISEMNFTANGGGWGRVNYRYIYPTSGVWFIH